MSDYIDREELVGWLTRPTGFRANCEDCGEIDCLDCILEDAIKEAPAADVQEIKHSEWIKTYNNPNDGHYYCPECHHNTDIATGIKTPRSRGFFYCPYCGAKMDGGNNNG